MGWHRGLGGAVVGGERGMRGVGDARHRGVGAAGASEQLAWGQGRGVMRLVGAR